MALLDTTLTATGAVSALAVTQEQNKVKAQFEEAKREAFYLRYPSTAYAVNDKVIILGKGQYGRFLMCTTAGTTSAGSLDYSALTTNNQTVQDGGVVWTVTSITNHIHNIADVSGLQTALDGKAALVHDHSGKANTTLDNISENIDYVIEAGGNYQLWYRKYRSGWLECGGWMACSGTYSTVTFLKPFVVNAPTVVLGGQNASSANSNGGTGTAACIGSRSLTSFRISYGDLTATGDCVCWFACGQGATEEA